MLPPVTRTLKALARPTVQLVRELPFRADLARPRGMRPLVVFLPCEGRVGAALLRIYAIADALQPFGWRCLIMPPKMTLAQRQRLLARAAPDVLVMRGARHALNRPEFYPGLPIVYDMDDADFHLPHLAGPVRAAMDHVDAVMAGSHYIANWCHQAGVGEVKVVWTGTPVSTRSRQPQSGRPPVIAWSQTRPQTYQREAALVRAVTAELAGVFPGLTLRLYDRQKGDDPGFAESFKTQGLSVEWVKSAKYSDYLASFDDVSIGLAPLSPQNPFNRGKSFGKVLAYLDREVPVLASDQGEHGEFFRAGLGILSNVADVWVSEGHRLLSDASARAQMAKAARKSFEARLSIQAAAEQVDGCLCSVVASTAEAKRLAG